MGSCTVARPLGCTALRPLQRPALQVNRNINYTSEGAGVVERVCMACRWRPTCTGAAGPDSAPPCPPQTPHPAHSLLFLPQTSAPTPAPSAPSGARPGGAARALWPAHGVHGKVQGCRLDSPAWRLALVPTLLIPTPCSKGKAAEALRGAPYLLTLEEVARRTAEAWDRGAAEVCMQGGIHPEFTGDTYLRLLGAAKSAAPDIHVHAFRCVAGHGGRAQGRRPGALLPVELFTCRPTCSPLEISQGASTLGWPLHRYLAALRDAGGCGGLGR